MTDQEMFDAWDKVTGPLEALKIVEESGAYLGGDSYYNDIVANLLNMVARVIAHNKPKD